MIERKLPSCPFCTGHLVDEGTMPDGTELFIRNMLGCLSCGRSMRREFLIEMAGERYCQMIHITSVATVRYSSRASGETTDAGGTAVANGLVTEKLLGKRWRASLGDASMVAPTKGDATERLMSMASQALAGDYTPFVVSYGAETAIVYRDPIAGWCYTIDACRVSLGYASRADAIERARLHLAQNAYPVQNGLDLLTKPSVILDHCSWLAFQRGYTYKLGTGASDNEAHQYACTQMECPRCWLTEPERIVFDTANDLYLGVSS